MPLTSFVSEIARLPSITTWTRVEPLPREGSMARSLQAQIRDPPGKVLAEAQHRRSEIRFLLVWPSWYRCSGILLPLVCLSYLALLWQRGSHPPVRAGVP